VTLFTDDFVPRLRSALGRRTAATVNEEGAQRASVAVVVSSGPEPALLFVKRREREGDPWSGHAALPGGFRSPTDVSAEATAERETEEETGLPLARVGERLGRLDDVFPRSVQLPKVIVSPLVFAVSGRLPVSPSNEIDAALWVPLAQVFDPHSRKPFLLSRAGVQQEFVSIHASGLVIWGLTERILSQLAEVVAQLAHPD
jgi:8-oxo-dGTP pyrophosphatase MutT (NUDIX family)